MQLMKYTQFCIIPVPIGKGDRLMPYPFQRIFRNANVGICSILSFASRQFVSLTDIAKDHARLGPVPVLGRRQMGCQ